MSWDRLHGLATAALPWGILVVLGVGALSGEVSESIQRLVQQNGAALLLVAILVQYAPRVIEAQRAQAAAMAELGAAVREIPRQQDLRIEQVQIGIQMILDRMEHLPCRQAERREDCGKS